MTNREYYKEQIIDIACKGNAIAMDKETNELCECDSIRCENCSFWTTRYKGCCETIKEWCDSEYCPFNVGDIVEVSDDGKRWNLRYFVKMVLDGAKCVVYKHDTEGLTEWTWKYCRKYGALGEENGNK